MKVLDKKKVLKLNCIRYAVSEKNIMQEINHPFIIKMYYAF